MIETTNSEPVLKIIEIKPVKNYIQFTVNKTQSISNKENVSLRQSSLSFFT